MLEKVLVANRGEIALRVMRTARRLGLKTVAVYSDADKGAVHCRFADEALRIGGPLPGESYLNVEALVRAAKETHADCVHPGYGFLSENSVFARACSEASIKFVGPGFTTLETSGNKVACKKLVSAAGVPVIPSSLDAVRTAEEAVGFAERFGYPVLLKSAFGGGGRGIREVHDANETRAGFDRAEAEARNAFGRAEIYVEKLIKPARHIEVQLMADENGHTIHLGERECSIQRRHQKLIELTPSPAVTDEMRSRIGGYAVKAARAIGYTNLGTVEFLLDSSGNFHFMEVNSRLQVEHPITEAVTGLDLVAEQFTIASGDDLTLTQGEVRHVGSAMECRVNAEDPLNGFIPDTGTITHLELPGGHGVRVDTALSPGSTVSEYYDSLLAKVIVRGRNYDDARRKMAVALSELRIDGIKTTVPLYREIMNEPRFIEGRLDTDYLDDTRIIEKLRSEESAKERERYKVAAAITAAILSGGVHKTVEMVEDSRKGRTRQLHRYYDAI